MFVTNHPAMKIQKALVISDLHIGLEYEIMKSGIIVRQVDDLIERTSKLLKLTRTKRLIIIGDVKHNIPYLKKEEIVSVPRFLVEMQSLAEVTIIPGNHDGSLKELCPGGIEITGSSGILLGKTGLLHGHAKPGKELENAEKFVIGHNHPLIRIQDKIGAKFFRQAWIRGKIKTGKELIVMPAFSKLVGGMIINDVKSEKELLGPLARNLNFKKADISLLDGTFIGKADSLPSKQ